MRQVTAPWVDPRAGLSLVLLLRFAKGPHLASDIQLQIQILVAFANPFRQESASCSTRKTLAMTQRPTHVPKFGNWDANEHIPFTAVFDHARAGKGGGKPINPNDPSENPAAFGLGDDDSAPQPPQPRPERRDSNEVGHNRPWEQGTGLPTRRPSGDGQEYQRPGGESHFKTTEGARKGSSHAGVRESGATEFGVAENYGADASPNHHAAYQGRLGNKPASASPGWERKVPSEGGTVFAPATPGKSRLRAGSTTRGDETPDRSPALPKFGDWNEKDPSSGEGFTVIFNQARNEKKTGGPVRIPVLQAESPARVDYGDAHKHANQLPHKYASDKKPSIWSCCFQA